MKISQEQLIEDVFHNHWPYMAVMSNKVARFGALLGRCFTGVL